MKKTLFSGVALAAMMAFSGAAWAEILVGVAGPLTGPNAAFGAQLQKGAEQAAADINAAGGINGEQIKLVFGTKEEAVAYAEKHGISFSVEEPNEARRRQISYSDNFRYDRKVPWTH